MIEYYDVSGCYVLRPWSYSIWEVIKGEKSILTCFTDSYKVLLKDWSLSFSFTVNSYLDCPSAVCVECDGSILAFSV